MRLTPEAGRVVGCLVEKQLTTPQAYPLTDTALIAACNQTTSRDPVVAYDLTTVRLAVRSLREMGLVRTVHRPGERSDKHRHELGAALELSAEQVAVLAVLLLRGPQTAAELRARTERMHPFGSVADVEQVLAELVERQLAERVARQPGRREDRYAETLVEAGGAVQPADAERPAQASAPSTPSADEGGQAHDDARAAGPVGGSPVQADRDTGEGHPPDRDTADRDTKDRLSELAKEVAMLREEVAALRERLEQLTG